MIKKLIIIAGGLSLVLPLVTLAKVMDQTTTDNQAGEATTTLSDPSDTTEQTTGETKKDTKKEELKRQLSDTINVYGAIVNYLQRLSQRLSEREDILITLKTLDEKSKEQIDSKREDLDDKLNSLDNEISHTLTKAAQVLLESNKPSRSLKDFKREATKIKNEILSAHKLILGLIDLIQKESAKNELGNQNIKGASSNKSN